MEEESSMAEETSNHQPVTVNSLDLSPPLTHKVGETSEISEYMTRSEMTAHSEPQHLVLVIPERTVDEDDTRINTPMPSTPQETPKKVNFSPFPSPAHAKFTETEANRPSMKSLIPRLSFKFRSRTWEIEKAAILALGGSPRQKAKMSRTKLFASKMKRTSSLPVTPIAHSNPESMHGRNTTEKGGAQHPIHRSYSVPDLIENGSVRQIRSFGGVFRIIPTNPGNIATPNVNPTIQAGGSNHEEGGEDIAEEEAVCRICLVELQEGANDTLKMECSCRGELALAHQECAVKWFSIKGNKTCEVCKQQVKNLPITLLRIQKSQRLIQYEAPRYRAWQDVPVLVIVSMLAYFCFLEQLLVRKMGSGAIAISLPFSCILGLLASMTSTTMVKRRYAWIYASIQFALVVLFSHLFYKRLKVQAVLAVVLATFAGFGGAMCGTSIIYALLKWSNQDQVEQSV